MVFIVEQNLVGNSAVMLVVFYRHSGIYLTCHGTLLKTWRHPQNRKYITYHNAARRKLSHGHRQRTLKLWWIRLCCFWVIRADRQTDRQTDILITILRTHREGEVITTVLRLKQWDGHIKNASNPTEGNVRMRARRAVRKNGIEMSSGCVNSAQYHRDWETTS